MMLLKSKLVRRAVTIIATGLALLAAGPVRADDTLVAVAANFAGAVEAIASEFTKDTGHTVQVTTGATGKLYAQIGEGAPFAILLSADAKTAEKLIAEGKAVSGSRFTYAVGKLSLWSPDPARIGEDPRAALTAADTLYVAIANPELAPYGVAAREALTTMGLWDTIQPKIVMGQNIGQTFSLVDTGAAQMGFVATSAVQVPGASPRGSRYDVPQDMFLPIRQDAVLLRAGEANRAAIAFMEYLRSERAKAIINSFGYDTE